MSGEPTLSKRITGVVLAGGMGRRMQGQDKGLVVIAGRPMISYALSALQANLSEMVINANRNVEQYQQFGVPVIGDSLDGYQGPLAGLEAALTKATTDWVYTCPCDSPLHQSALLPTLWQATQNESASIALAHDGERTQPVFSLVKVNLLESLREYLNAGERKIDHWFARHRFIEVDCSSCADSFININTDADKQAVERQLLSQQDPTE